MHATRLPRRATALALVLVLALPASAAWAATEGASIDKTGWWNRANSATETPAAPVTVPPPPGVPEGDLVAGQVNGEPTALAAVGIQPEEGPGATVRSFTLTLREDPDAGGNQGAADAVVFACPITSFWAGGENGTWDTVPEHDCAAAQVAGERDDEGTWRFDLAPVAELWFDTFGTIRADGVALVPDVEAEASFQVVWLGGDDIDVALDAEPAPEGEDPFAAPPTPDPPSDAGLSSGPGGGGSSLFAPPRIASPPTVSTPALDAAADTGAADDVAAADGSDEVAAAPTEPASVTEPLGTKAGEILGNLPLGSYLLVPVALATLLALSYWLGPAGQPSTVDRRGGVSRALAARARAAQER
ncbi:MAG TPA: hypothetical protein VFU14_17000 [Acidimicrobiales bacterium]|nr:hypothetical protein [Acidimicrobiales bacterium]